MPRTAVNVAGTVFLITLCGLGLGAPSVRAEHHEHGEGHGERKAMDPAAYVAKLTEELGLDQAQSAQVAAIVQEHHANIQSTKDQMKPLKEQIKEQKQAKYDAIKAVLTPEQQVAFAEMKSEKRGHDKHGPDCGCASCALEKAESSESEE